MKGTGRSLQTFVVVKNQFDCSHIHYMMAIIRPPSQPLAFIRSEPFSHSPCASQFLFFLVAYRHLHDDGSVPHRAARLRSEEADRIRIAVQAHRR